MSLTDIRPAPDTDSVIEEPPRNTSKVNLPESCILRRTTLDRTALFVPEAESYSELRCSSSITQYIDRDSKFHSLTKLNGRTAKDYAKTTVHCWHDTQPFDGPVVPIPKSYDPTNRCFHVFGCFCSLSCAKAFVCEHTTFETNMQLVLLERMGTEVYGIQDIVAAPPRLSLDIFGGPFSLERFRSLSKTCESTLIVPPFISSYMVCEERQMDTSKVSALGINGISSVRGLRRPAQPVDMGSKAVPKQSPYLEFRAKMDAATASSTATASSASNASNAAASSVQPTQHSEPMEASPKPVVKTRIATRSGSLAKFLQD